MEKDIRISLSFYLNRTNLISFEEPSEIIDVSVSSIRKRTYATNFPKISNEESGKWFISMPGNRVVIEVAHR